MEKALEEAKQKLEQHSLEVKLKTSMMILINIDYTCIKMKIDNIPCLRYSKTDEHEWKKTLTEQKDQMFEIAKQKFEV